MPFNSGIGGNKVVPFFGGAQVANPSNVTVQAGAPSTNMRDANIGDIYVNKTASSVYICVASTGLAGGTTWAVVGGSSADINTINSNAPVAGNYVLAGTANQISKAETAGTTTFSLPAAITAPGSLTTTTALTATLGNITATNGNIVLGTAGNKISSTSVGSTTTAGANSFGTVALVGGTATVATTAVTANSMIFLQCQALGTVAVAKAMAVTAKTASTSFVITSADATDTSTVAWFIVN